MRSIDRGGGTSKRELNWDVSAAGEMGFKLIRVCMRWIVVIYVPYVCLLDGLPVHRILLLIPNNAIPPDAMLNDIMPVYTPRSYPPLCRNLGASPGGTICACPSSSVLFTTPNNLTAVDSYSSSS